MEEFRKELIAGSLETALEDLESEKFGLAERLNEVDYAIADLLQLWRKLGLKPVPGRTYQGLLPLPLGSEPSHGEAKTEPQALEDLIDSELGLTDRIRAILKANPDRELSPIEVRDLLLQTGFNPEGRSNHMAEIHLVLKRITEGNRRITKRETESGTLYKFSLLSRQRRNPRAKTIPRDSQEPGQVPQ
ncbi:MAG: hypothetical protein M3Y27_03590 [Acidobacteriota bacterium]|nr:hypothetical protein [Acidobacteriota bacterium]